MKAATYIKNRIRQYIAEYVQSTRCENFVIHNNCTLHLTLYRSKSDQIMMRRTIAVCATGPVGGSAKIFEMDLPPRQDLHRFAFHYSAAHSSSVKRGKTHTMHIRDERMTAIYRSPSIRRRSFMLHKA